MNHRCPRRNESALGIAAPGDPDVWTDRESHRECSWCGSIHPDDFINMVSQGAELTPSDKSHKVYVDKNFRFHFQHLSRRQQQQFIELFNIGKLNVGSPGYFFVEPYFFFIHREKRSAHD